MCLLSDLTGGGGGGGGGGALEEVKVDNIEKSYIKSHYTLPMPKF